MNLYVPEIGDRLKLTADWSFDLYNEYRNQSLLKHFGYEFSYSSRDTSVKVVIPSGTILKVDRVYIRQGLQEFSSISFYAEGLGIGKGSFGKPKTSRFWAKLIDCNKIQFEIETSVISGKPALNFSEVLDLKKSDRFCIYYDKEVDAEKHYVREVEISASRKYNAKPVFYALITSTNTIVCEKDEMVRDSMSKFNPFASSYRVRHFKRTRENLLYQLLDADKKPLGIEANSKASFLKKVKEYYTKS